MSGKNRKSKKPSATRAESLLEDTTYFIDECPGTGIGFDLRSAGLKVEFHKDHFQPGEEDAVWIPEVSARGWVIITKDKAIRRNDIEREAIIRSKARVFTFQKASYTETMMIDIFTQHRLKLGRILKNATAPYIVRLSRSDAALVELSEKDS